eukprot:1518012-Alexandrium_andersonii.AAC.1
MKVRKLLHASELEVPVARDPRRLATCLRSRSGLRRRHLRPRPGVVHAKQRRLLAVDGVEATLG